MNGLSGPLAGRGFAAPAGLPIAGLQHGTPLFYEPVTSDPRTGSGLNRALGASCVDTSGNLYLKISSAATGWVRLNEVTTKVPVERKGPLLVAAQNQTFSSLVGNTDKFYRLRGKLINDDAGGSALYSLQLNGGAIAIAAHTRLYGNTAAAFSDAPGYFAFAAASGGVTEFCIEGFAKSGEFRLFRYTSAIITAAGASSFINQGYIVTINTATEITSVTVASDRASGIGVNSEIVLEKEIF